MLIDQSMTIKEFLNMVHDPYDSCAEPEVIEIYDFTLFLKGVNGHDS
jgi:hypothetical protein